MRMFRFLVALAFAIAVTSSPAPPCPDPPYNNAISKSVVEALEAARPFMRTGIPKWGIPPLDPLGPLPPIPISVHDEYLRLDGFVSETVVDHLSDFVVCEMTIEVGLRPRFLIRIDLDRLSVAGEYDVDGSYVSLFPIYGRGHFTLDVFEARTSGGAKVKYNLLADRAQISELQIDVSFKELQIFLECILGCGDMADVVNKHLGDAATAAFDVVWRLSNPLLTKAIEDAVNEALWDIKISEWINKRSSSFLDPEITKRLVMKLPLRLLDEARSHIQAN